MPKERRDQKSRISPYKCSTSHHPKRSSIKNPLESDENHKGWEEARCPVCMEHPHNAILLLCSSHDKNCRPYMCDTSYRHSNCFDQFKKSFSSPKETPVTTTEPPPSAATVPEHVLCPLCRGKVNGWVVVDAARVYMNMKSRTCASETCEFFGTYTDLRKHARLVHPLVRPSETDPERRREWRRMERQRDLGDLLSTLRSSMGVDEVDESGGALSFDENGWLRFFFLIRVFRSGSGSRSSRGHVTVRRWVRTRLWGENDDGHESSDGGSGLSPGPRNLFRLSRRSSSPDNDES